MQARDIAEKLKDGYERLGIISQGEYKESTAVLYAKKNIKEVFTKIAETLNTHTGKPIKIIETMLEPLEKEIEIKLQEQFKEIKEGKRSSGDPELTDSVFQTLKTTIQTLNEGLSEEKKIPDVMFAEITTTGKKPIQDMQNNFVTQQQQESLRGYEKRRLEVLELAREVGYLFDRVTDPLEIAELDKRDKKIALIGSDSKEAEDNYNDLILRSHNAIQQAGYFKVRDWVNSDLVIQVTDKGVITPFHKKGGSATMADYAIVMDMLKLKGNTGVEISFPETNPNDKGSIRAQVVKIKQLLELASMKGLKATLQGDPTSGLLHMIHTSPHVKEEDRKIILTALQRSKEKAELKKAINGEGFKEIEKILEGFSSMGDKQKLAAIEDSIKKVDQIYADIYNASSFKLRDKEGHVLKDERGNEIVDNGRRYEANGLINPMNDLFFVREIKKLQTQMNELVGTTTTDGKRIGGKLDELAIGKPDDDVARKVSTISDAGAKVSAKLAESLKNPQVFPSLGKTEADPDARPLVPLTWKNR